MKSVVVFCGSRFGSKEIYRHDAQKLGRALAERDLTLVYGGGHVGLMGAVAEACLDAGGKVIGVIPQFMVERELGYGACSQLEVVDSMHTRKARMAELAEKCNEGLLTPTEQAEYESYVHAVDMISVLQAKARVWLARHVAS